VVKGPYAIALAQVRSGLLRALVSAVMTCFDKQGTDRASVGQLLAMLEDDPVVAKFQTGPAGAGALRQARGQYRELIASSLYKEAKDFRDAAVGHLLVGLDIPEVTYETFYALHDQAEQLASHLTWHAAVTGTRSFENVRAISRSMPSSSGTRILKG
jgi:hypothetical protein